MITGAKQLRDDIVSQLVAPEQDENRDVRAVVSYEGKTGHWIKIDLVDRVVFVEVTEMRRASRVA